MEKIDTNACFVFAWDVFKKRAWFFIGFTALVFAISIATTVIRAQLSSLGSDLIDGIGFILAIGVSVYVGFAQTKLYLKAHDALESITFRELWASVGFWKFALLSIVLGIGLILGFVLLVIPGIILSLLSIFAIYVYTDQRVEPYEAFKQSIALTKDHLWEVFIFMLELICINLLGALFLLVGLLISVPISLLATVHLYRLIQKENSVKV